MNTLVRFLAFLNTLPARFKGLKVGKNSFLGPGYNYIFGNFNGVRLGKDVYIDRNAQISLIGRLANVGSDNEIIIGDGTKIGRNFICVSCKKIRIGKNCEISHNVSVYDHEHNVYNRKIPPTKSGFTKIREVIIEDDCFIGAHSFILKGVHLSKHCVVGANSVVTKSFPAYSIIAGSPARLIKKI